MVKVGDEVVRNLAGARMTLVVTKLTKDRIVCGPWEFGRETGAEIDKYLKWGPLRSGSYLESVAEENDVEIVQEK